MENPDGKRRILVVFGFPCVGMCMPGRRLMAMRVFVQVGGFPIVDMGV